MDLGTVTQILNLVHAGSVEQAVNLVTATVSGLALAAPTRQELLSAVRPRCEDGSFGICVDCKGPISPERLASKLLTATRCTPCGKKLEQSWR